MSARDTLLARAAQMRANPDPLKPLPPARVQPWPGELEDILRAYAAGDMTTSRLAELLYQRQSPEFRGFAAEVTAAWGE